MEPIEEEMPKAAEQTSGTDGKGKTQEELERENRELKRQNLLLQAEMEYRKKLQALVEEKAHEKTGIIRGLVQGERFRGKVRFRDFLHIAGLSKSTYEYNVKRLEKPENPDEIRIRAEIRSIWLKSGKRYDTGRSQRN